MNRKILAISVALAMALPISQAEAKLAKRSGIVDALLRVSSGQQVTADAVSTETIDNGNVTPKRNLAVGEPMGYLVVITAIGTNTGSAKLTAIQSAAAALTSPQILGEIDLATADIVAGATFIIPIGHGIPALRFYGINYDITGTVDFTVTAFFGPISMLSQRALTYAKGYTIS